MIPYEKITNFLKSHNIAYEEIEHEAVFTSEQAAKVRGMSMNQGAKSLLLRSGGEFVLAVLPGDKRLDSKKIRQILGRKELCFATPEEVEKVMGCQIGACYPFGSLLNIRTLVDNSLSKNEIISFNPGVHTKSVKIRWEDYKSLTSPELVDISQ